MAITTQSFTTLVRQQAAAIQAKASAVLSFVVGSIELARAEAVAAVAMWLQSIVLQLLATTRLSTSTDSDIDSFVADFGLTREAAVAATGTVAFSRYTAMQSATIPVGSLVQTADGTQPFAVIADTTQAFWNAASNAYVIPSGTTSGNVTVKAVNAGAQGNVNANTITTISTAIVGVDTVNNAAAFVNGSDAETDAALQTRFTQYIASLAKATKGAIGFAITSLQTGVTYTLVENQQYGGATDYGYFYVVVDDGTGSPSSAFLSSASNAIDAVRGASIRFGVFAPVVVNAAIAMTATVASGYDPVATKALAQTAITNYVNALQLGQTLPYTRLAQVAYDASPGITNITGVTLNSGTADLAATSKQVIKAQTVTVS